MVFSSSSRWIRVQRRGWLGSVSLFGFVSDTRKANKNKHDEKENHLKYLGVFLSQTGLLNMSYLHLPKAVISVFLCSGSFSARGRFFWIFLENSPECILGSFGLPHLKLSELAPRQFLPESRVFPPESRVFLPEYKSQKSYIFISQKLSPEKQFQPAG